MVSKLRFVTIFGLLLLLASAFPASAGNPNPGVLPGNSTPHGRSYAEWSAAWWQWALGVPTPHNPMLDSTGADCAAGQAGKVWFLAGSFGSDPVERTCSRVPAGSALYFPIINVFYGAFLNDPPALRDETYARQQVACTYSDLWAEIDGVELTITPQYYETTPLFDVQFPADNIFGLTPDVMPELLLSPTVDAGYYLFVAPLTPGAHTLRWKGTQTCLTGTSTQDVTYHLTVK